MEIHQRSTLSNPLQKEGGGVVDVKPILNYIQNVNIEAVFELKMGQRFVMAMTLEQTLP
jgi:hypothetical protein